MTIELQMLGWAIVLGLVHIGVAAAFATAQRGESAARPIRVPA